MSSGERKRMMAKPCSCDTRRGLRSRCRGKRCPSSDGGGGGDKAWSQANGIEFPAVEGDGPVAGSSWPVDAFSQVARDSWNPA